MRLDSPDIIGTLTISTVNNGTGDILTYSGTTVTRRTPVQLLTDIGGQQLLVSGTNIKTINGNSLLGSGDLIITSGAGGIEWNTTSSNLTAEIDKGYITTNNSTLVTITLPNTSTLGVIRVSGNGDAGWRVSVPGGYTLKFIDISITSYIESTKKHDSIEILCVGSNTFQVITSIGNLNYL